MFGVLHDFVMEYFLSPGYNIVNTLTYGVVLGLLVFKFVIPFLKPRVKKFDLRFLLMLVPYVVYGSTLRELVDQDLGLYAGHTEYPANYMLVSPGIFFTMFAVTLAILLVGLVLQKRFGWDYRLFVGGVGSLMVLYNLTLIVPNISNLPAFLNVLVFFTISAAFLYALKLLLRLDYLGLEGNFYIALVHLFDASTTFVGIDLLGHVEKHVVPTFFIELTGTAAVMYPLKIILVLLALHVIDDEVRDDEFTRRFVKFVVVVLGAGPGLRNATLLLMG
ncbi:MAG: DUF63 family protein [Candidatus Altiarchaeales archaeon]|nr:DUF63 family protein [Candidatus Altiarchaeales archaeon]MBD3416332.1 DUF63 family protein [Candidatus Altiarchaeales archaeon]